MPCTDLTAFSPDLCHAVVSEPHDNELLVELTDEHHQGVVVYLRADGTWDLVVCGG